MCAGTSGSMELTSRLAKEQEEEEKNEKVHEVKMAGVEYAQIS